MQTRAATPESEKFQLASVALLMVHPLPSFQLLDVLGSPTQ